MAGSFELFRAESEMRTSWLVPASPEAMMALLALDSIDYGPIGERAWELALSIADYSLPSWIPWVGHADISWCDGRVRHPTGTLVLIEAWRPDESHTIGVYIDHRLGGIAKHLGVTRADRCSALWMTRSRNEGESFMREMRVVEPASRGPAGGCGQRSSSPTQG